MKKITAYELKGLTKADNKTILDYHKQRIELSIDKYGRVYNEGGQYIADAAEVESGCGIGCN